MTGVEAMAAERKRQVKEEGWTAEHDAGHDEDELALAAAAYILGSPVMWPWSNWWKPKNRRSDLIRAGALIAAELDRLNGLPQ